MDKGKQMGTDGDLVRMALSGDASAYEVLVERHYKTAMAVCFGITGSREDSEDIVQDIFLRSFERLASIQEPDKFSHYVVSAARNAALNVARRHKALQQKQLAILRRFKDDFRTGESGEPSAGDLGARGVVRQQLQRLPAKYREVLCLFYFDELKTAEIAKLLQVSDAAVRKRIEYGRNYLKAAMEAEIGPAVQDEKERKAHLGVLFAGLRSLPAPTVSQMTRPAPAGRDRGIWLSGIVATSVICVVIGLWYAKPAWNSLDFLRLGPVDDGRAETAVNPVAESAQSGYSTDRAPTAEVSPNAVATSPVPDAVIHIGPPPYSANAGEVAVLESVASEVSKAYGGTILIDIDAAAENTASPAKPLMGNVLLLDCNPLTENSSLYDLIAKGAIVPLSDRVSAPDFGRDDFFPNLWHAATLGGEVWAIPVLAQSWALGINSNFVELDSAILASESWSGLFEALASRLSAQNGDAIAARSYFQVSASWLWDTLLVEAGGDLDQPDILRGTVWQKTKEEFGRLYEAYPSILPFTANTAVPPGTRSIQIVNDGLGRADSLGQIKQHNRAWTVIAPSVRGPVVPSHITLAAIRRSVPSEEALAWQFIKSLVSPARMEGLSRQGAITPVRRSVASRLSDPDTQVFVTQVENMKYPSPSDGIEEYRAERDLEIRAIVQGGGKSAAGEG